MKRLVLLMLLLMQGMICWPQVKDLPSAKHKEYYSDGFFVSASGFDYKQVTHEIVGNANTSYDKARAIYLWLCDNIEYDQRLEIRTADECWQTRKGVCQGYCELFFRMAETVGVKVKLVNGMGKSSTDPKHMEKHVWLSIATEEGEILADPTWGAGLFVNHKFVRQPQPLIWFDTNPYWFAFTHMPQKKKHLHLDRELSEGQFEAIPYVNPLIGKLGIAAREALTQALAGETDFPKIPILNTESLKKVTLQEVPKCKYLEKGKSYVFVIEKKQDNMKILLNNEGSLREEERWTKEGRCYKTTVEPKKSGKFTLEVSNGSTFVPAREVILEYVVK